MGSAISSTGSTGGSPRVAAAPNPAPHPTPPGPAAPPPSPRPLAGGVDAFDAAPIAQMPPSPRPFQDPAQAPAALPATDLPLSRPAAHGGATTPASAPPADGSSSSSSAPPRRRLRRRRKPLPPQMALEGAGDDAFGVNLRSLTWGIMAFTLRGRHRRPATNPTPTARHDVLLCAGGDGDGDGGGDAVQVQSAREARLMSRSDGGRAVAGAGIVMEAEVGGSGGGVGGSKVGMAITVAGCMPPTVRAGGRRPRPLAIAGVEAHHYNVSTILPGRLLIGGEDVGGSEATLVRLGVKGVVNATRDGREEAVAATTGGGTAASGAATTTTTEPRPSSWCYVKLGWVDEVTQPILPDLDRAFACIEEARRRGGPCLVFCKKGMSRSGAVVVAYLMTTQDMSLWEALTFARDRRAIIAPNVGFMAQLVELERRTRGKVSLDLEAYEMDRFGDDCSLAAASSTMSPRRREADVTAA